MPHTGEAGQAAMLAAPGSDAGAIPGGSMRTGDADKDRPLREDTRLLGRILGDTVREQQGERVFDIIERIRQTSIRFRRDEDEAARRELGEIMDELSRAEASQIIRAFGYFSHLANIAEDQHRIRRNHAHAMVASPPRDGSMARALARARDAGVTGEELWAFLKTATISPVLTAHPTEVRRKSMIDREMEVADLLAERDRPDLTPGELAANEEGLWRAVLTLWQTSLLRRTRLRVSDEVANGLAYYDYAELVTDVDLRDAVFAWLRAERQATIEALLAITGQASLLESNPLLARSIRNRFPYLDPLNHMQIELLKRYRAGDTADDVVAGIHLTINGIAAGLRNSG